jgi:hypothetical protein
LIIEKKMLEGMGIELLPDAPDGSRVAITTEAQTIYGPKTFITGVRGVEDAGKADKTLIVKSEVDDAFTDFPVDRIEQITLTSTDIGNRSLTLAAPVPSGLEAVVQFQLDGSDWFYSMIRFDVVGDVLSWSGFDYTEEKLKAGDVLYIHYLA